MYSNHPKYVNSTDGQTKYNWCDYQQKMKPQSNAVAGGIILMLVSGLHIGWGLFNISFRMESWAQTETIEVISMTVLSFYIAAILGGFVTAFFFLKDHSKKTIYMCTSIMFIVSSVILIIEPSKWYVILLSRCLAGFAHAVTYLTAITHAAEVVVKELRGMLLFSLHYCLIISIYTVSVFIESLRFDQSVSPLEPIRMVGILGTVYSLMALLFLPMFFKESPIFLMQKERNNEALQVMIKLRNETNETWEIRNDFQENRAMVDEDDKLSPKVFTNRNLQPLLLVLASALIFVASFNYPLNNVKLMLARNTAIYEYDISPTVLLTVRTLFGVIFMSFCDKIRRKLLQTVSAVLSGIVLIVIGIIFNAMLDVPFELYLTLFVLYECAASIGIGAMPTIFASEAFPLTKKPMSLAILNLFENLLHIILIATTINANKFADGFINGMIFGCAAIMIIVAGYLYKELPETRIMSLRQARAEFRHKGEVLYSGNSQPSGIVYA